MDRWWRLAKAEDAASSTIGAWWRSARGVERFRLARKGVVALQGIARGRRARREASACWFTLGCRFSRHKAATVIQVGLS